MSLATNAELASSGQRPGKLLNAYSLYDHTPPPRLTWPKMSVGPQLRKLCYETSSAKLGKQMKHFQIHFQALFGRLHAKNPDPFDNLVLTCLNCRFNVFPECNLPSKACASPAPLFLLAFTGEQAAPWAGMPPPGEQWYCALEVFAFSYWATSLLDLLQRRRL